jgi:hypothetical protein
LRQHELIDKLVPDPAQPQTLAVLSGLLGRSPRSGYWRLYLTAAFDEFAEVREEDIVHSQSLTPAQSALGRTIVWVRSGASVQHTRQSSRQTQAEFLQGTIATRYVTSAAAFQTSLRSRVNPQLRFNSVNFCPSDCCSADVPISCPTHWGCGPDTNLDCGYSDEICNP